MSLIKYTIALLFCGVVAQAASSSGKGVGLNVGVGVPFLGQGGINYQFSDKFGLALGYNYLNLDAGLAKATLSMPEVMINFFPFSGAFFIGAGVGQEALKVTAKDSLSTNEVTIDVKAMTTIVKTGWMWGRNNGGFWFGMDVAFVNPSSPDITIEAGGLPPTNPSYQDALDAAKKFGETSYVNLTFARFGWIF